jgi:hypothetical protein
MTNATIETYPASVVDSIIGALEQRVVALEQGQPNCAPGGGGVSIRVITSNSTTSTDLFRTWNEPGGFRQRFHVPDAGVVIPFLNADLIHRNLVSGPVGWGLRVQHRMAPTEGGLGAALWAWIPHHYAAGNIASIEDHYGGRASFAPLPIPNATWVELRVMGNSHSSAAPNTDGLAELHQPSPSADYNLLMTLILTGPNVTIG